jgi:hypothetical protein
MIKLVDNFYVDFILKCPFNPQSNEINLNEVKLITYSQLCDIKENSSFEEDKFNRPRNIIRSYMDIKLDNLKIIKPFKNYLVENTNNIKELKNEINIKNNNDNNIVEKDLEINTNKNRKRSKKFKNNNSNIELLNNMHNYDNSKNKRNKNNDISNSIVNKNNNDSDNDNYNDKDNDVYLSSNSRQNSHKFENDYNSIFNQNLYHQKNNEIKRKNILKKITDTPVTADKDSNKKEKKNILITNSNVKKLNYEDEEDSREIFNFK